MGIDTDSPLMREIQERATAVFDSRAAAAVWLTNSQASLDSRTPAELANDEAGAAELLRLLDLIDHSEYF
jgi:uncharacterized protein (DUF2384 family)